MKSSKLPPDLQELMTKLTLDTSVSEAVERSPHNAFSPSLVSHAVKLHTDRVNIAAKGTKPMNVFTSTPKQQRNMFFSRSYSDASVTFSENSDEDNNDVVIEIDKCDQVSPLCPPSEQLTPPTSHAVVPSAKLNSLDLRISIFEEDNWASSGIRPPAGGLGLLRSSSDDMDFESRRQSLRKSPRGSLHVKGFSEGIGQYGINRRPPESTCTTQDDVYDGFGDDSSSQQVHDWKILPMKDRMVVMTKIGQGASGVVYKAFDIGRMILVALKTVSILDRDKRHQMVRELNTQYNLLRQQESDGKNCTNFSDYNNSCDSAVKLRANEPRECIVKFFDAFSELDDAVALIVEYMDAGSLQDLVDAGGCANEGVLANIASQAIKGLNFLHQKNQIHRDIKPANLLINLNGDVKISDLGILREVNPEVDTDHLVQTYIGTATYMSPERLDTREYSYPSDIWSFGMSMLTLSFGKLPQQISQRYWTLLSNILEKPSPSLSDDDNPTHVWSSEYHDFISQCLQKDPSQRPTAQELLSHPFLKKAQTDNDDVHEIKKIGGEELQSVLHSLWDHLEQRELSALDVYIVLCEVGEHEERTTTTLEVFNLTVQEMMNVLLFDEFPDRVMELFDSMKVEMNDDPELEGSTVKIFHRFCSWSEQIIHGGSPLSELASQLHLSAQDAISIARHFIDGIGYGKS